MKIVLTSWGSFGDLHPYMALALELQRRGHHPVIATIPSYREKVERAGISFHPVRPDFPPLDQITDIIRRAVDAREGPRYIWTRMIAPYLRETYEDTLAAVRADGGADLLVSHMITVVAPIIAEKTGVPWVSTVLAPISFFSVYDPPSPPHFPALRRVAALHPAVARGLWALGKWSTRSWVEPVARLRKEVGLPPGKHPVFEGQHSPELVLALFSTVLSEIQPDFPPRTRITGFPFYDETETLTPDVCRYLDEGEAPILFTLGSSAFWVADDFYRISIEAARRLNRRALLLIGDERNRPSTLPPGAAAFSYAPYVRVMSRASCIVHQGGVGTTGQALRSGHPMLIMPFGHDTVDNARRCAELGVARVVFRKRYTVENVVRELQQLLEVPAYGKRAAEIGRRVASENGVRTACDAIEQLRK
jgi:MGT family glycosyltransferase